MKACPPKHRWPTSVPDIVWAPLASGAILLIVGAFAVAVNQPLLFPSLGPTAYLQAESPERPTSRFYNVVVGHLLGLGAGVLVTALSGLWHVASIPATEHLSITLIPAAAFALSLTMLSCLVARASHPPAAATTLLVVLGVIRTIPDILHLILGVLIIATFGEALRRMRIGEFRR